MNSQKPEYYRNKNKSKPLNQKRRAQRLIICFLSIIIGITTMCFAIMSIMENKAQENIVGNTIIFYEADYEYDIMKDEHYLELDRNIRFENSQNGITIEIVDGNLNDVPTDIRDSFIVINNFIDYAIAGKYQELNDLFSDEYVEADGDLKMDFTMQQLYNIKVTYITDTTTETNGYTYPSQDFWLEYMIRKNNGTFRNDMASDCIKKEYVRITNREGDLKIDVLAPYKTEVKTQQKIDNKDIISIIVVSVLVITAVSAICIIANKKYGIN